MPSNNWTDYFISRHDNADADKNTTVYVEAWAQDKSHKEKLALLTNDANAIIFASDINHNIISLHSFVKFGGKLLCPTAKTGCLVGNG